MSRRFSILPSIHSVGGEFKVSKAMASLLPASVFSRFKLSWIESGMLFWKSGIFISWTCFWKYYFFYYMCGYRLMAQETITPEACQRMLVYKVPKVLERNSHLKFNIIVSILLLICIILKYKPVPIVIKQLAPKIKWVNSDNINSST